MKPSDIQIGTTYRIRQWQDMVEELGVDKHGAICHPTQRSSVFDPRMQYLCGKEYTPSHVSMSGDCEPGWEGAEDNWAISAFMLEPLTEKSPAPAPTLRIGRFTLSRHDAESLWIATEDGEGGQFKDEVVEEALREMYRKHNQGGVK